MAGRMNSELPTLNQVMARAHLRLLLVAVVLSAISLMIVGASMIRSSAQHNLDLVAQSVSYTVEPAILFGDRPAIREGISSIAGDNVAFVEVRNPEGDILAVWMHPASANRSWFTDIVNRLIWPAPCVRHVTKGGATIAEIRVYGSSIGILGYAATGVTIALFCLGLTVMATKLLAKRLDQDVILPLRRFAQAAHSVRNERAFSTRVPAAGIAEVNRLAQDFNALLSELQRWHSSLTSENEELAYRASHDPLTGLGNRDLFETQLVDAIEKSSRTNIAFTVLYIDMNKFKNINDCHGHDAGDAALIEVASRLRQTLGREDSTFRVGGDEFAVIVRSSVQETNVKIVTQRIQDAMQPAMQLPTGSGFSFR